MGIEKEKQEEDILREWLKKSRMMTFHDLFNLAKICISLKFMPMYGCSF